MNEDRNARLRERIEAGKERSAAFAQDAAGKARALVEEHPVAALAGGILLGALVASALPTRPSRKLRKRASKLATLGAEMALAYAARAAEAGKDGVGKLEELGGSLGEKIGEGGSEARKRAGDLAEALIDGALAAARKAGKLTDRIRP